MQSNKVELCGVDTTRLKVLSEAEKVELLKRMRQGDTHAREELVQGNLKLVLSVIQRFSGRGESADDLFQVGVIGLMKAIDHFDLNVGVRFSTYAVPMIIGELRRHLRDYSAVRVSRSLKDVAYRAMQAREELTKTLDREPTIDEITKRLDLPRATVVMALESVVEPISLYEPIFSDGGDTIYVMDQIGDSNSENDWLDELVLKESIQQLAPREKNILTLRFLRGKTQMEVAREIGISQAQVSRLEKAALGKIKENLQE
jgi:RNA polymerase sporulation-specific sigma factor